MNNAAVLINESEPVLTVDDVTLQYRTRDLLVTAAWRISFSAFRSERLILLGPSGCGKSTLLKAIGGCINPARGRIMLNGIEVRNAGPDRVMMFQEFDQLLPWKTVRENIVFALTASGKMNRHDSLDQAAHYLRKVKLDKFADSYPHTLSGGMKQRAAIARCLAMKPEIVLMDEPFAALDALTRQQMQDELLELWSEIKFTMLFVTHSIPEAIVLGSRVVVLSPHPGRVTADIPVDIVTLGGKECDVAKELQERIYSALYNGVADYSI